MGILRTKWVNLSKHSVKKWINILNILRETNKQHKQASKEKWKIVQENKSSYLRLECGIKIDDETKIMVGAPIWGI